MNFRKNALDAAARGWPVLPLRGKMPLTTHGFKDAVTDPGQIEQWAARHPNANIGMRTGAESRVSVLDVDPRNGGDESLHLLEREHGPLPETASVVTGGGGEHLYYRHPGGHVRSGPLDPKRYPGLDVKADNGYVVAVGSIHPETGRPYEWDRHPDEVTIAPMPGCLLAPAEPAARANVIPLALKPRADDDPATAYLRQRPPVEYVEIVAGIKVEVGDKIKCPAPDHNDATPSCHIYADHWHCYGCGRGGGIFEFGALVAGRPLPVRGSDFLAIKGALLARYEKAKGVAAS